MSFIEDIKKCFSVEELACEPLYKVIFFGDSAMYMENVRCIVSYSPECLIVSLKRGGLKIVGENLYVKKFCGGDVAVCGKIIKMERI